MNCWRDHFARDTFIHIPARRDSRMIVAVMANWRRLGMARGQALLTLTLSLAFGSATVRAEQPIGPVSMIAEINARTITSMLHQSKPGERPNLSGKFLAYLDLSELDFKGAIMARSDFYGTDFTGANLSGADLSATRLDRSVLIRANLSGANLTRATILRPTIYSDLSNNTLDAPRFSGANLTGVHLQAELSGSDFRGADLTDANFYPLEGRPGGGRSRRPIGTCSSIVTSRVRGCTTRTCNARCYGLRNSLELT